MVAKYLLQHCCAGCSSGIFNVCHSICCGFVMPVNVSLTNTVCFSSLSHSVAEKALYITYYSLFCMFPPLLALPTLFHYILTLKKQHLCSACQYFSVHVM